MRWAAPLVAALLLLAALAPVAVGAPTAATTAGQPSTTALTAPPKARTPAAPREISSKQAERLAARVPKIAAVRRQHPGSTLSSKRKDGRWVVDVWTKDPKAKQVGQVYVSLDGHVTESWTGFQVAWTMARGYPGAFGQSVNNPWIWVTLSILFVAPFVDLRRPKRMLHLDLLALVGFGASLAFFNDANLGLSVPLAAPLLAYLAARLAWIGLRRAPAAPGDALRLAVPWQVLAVAALFLIGLRVGLNAVDGNVIDVGYSGVIGADKLAHGRDLYGAFPLDNDHGDTYGPLLYLSYIPFELVWPWHGRWDDLPAAHAAAGAFDLACVLLLFLIGRRLRGTPLAVALVYAWVTFPFTIYATNSGVNDALPAALVLAAIWVHGRPAARGALSAAAGLTKFAPLALLPLMAAHGLAPGGPRVRPLAKFAAGAALIAALAGALVLTRTSPAVFLDRTVGFQFGREAPFSLWGFYGGGWEIAQRVVQAGVVVFAVAVAFVPRRDDVVGLAALSGAILVGLQFATTYWFYTYLVWAVPLALIALLGRLPAPAAERAGIARVPLRRPAAGRAPAPARSHPPAPAPSSG